ncbi:MAG TPA: PHP domain-containing protein [Gammaproteobacteria bacterium]|nr:PHP domain-containing protein [Gammaproteobacteria bacterium]
MKLDLHTHSTASDGVLAPAALLAQAIEADVELFSITDHDSLAAYDAIAGAPLGRLRLLPGIELTAQWRGQVVHVLGYGFDAGRGALRAGVEAQRRRRAERAAALGARLARLGIADTFEGARALAGEGSIGRPHFARHLLAVGAVRSVEEAFEKYLGDRATAGVGSAWASLDEAVAWIRADGGQAVLAHPVKYRYTHTRLRELLADFVAAGGCGLEVLCGRQPPGALVEMAKLCQRFGLEASMGSDFHAPEAWQPAPGVMSRLPHGIPALWERWAVCA